MSQRSQILDLASRTPISGGASVHRLDVGRRADSHLDWTAEQHYVHNAINLLGGYWDPKAAVARILEELSELAICLEHGVGSTAEELADLKIITTCIANQFNVGLHQSNNLRIVIASGDVNGPSFTDLVRHAGRIARIINHYAGPKTPKPVEHLEHLAQPILDLHRDLAMIADTLRVDLGIEVAKKLQLTLARDRGRFSQTFDPATAEVLDQFSETVNTTACTFARAAKLWGGPTWRANRSIAWNCDVTVPYLRSFARAANAEGLDGFIIAPVTSAPPTTLTEVGHLLYNTLRTLGVLDPDNIGPVREIVAEPGWQFSFSSQRMFITVFSDLYRHNHPRHCASGSFFMLQPEESFSIHGVGRSQKDSDKIKANIRNNFAKHGVTYPLDAINSRIEAHLYLLPEEGRPVIPWWDPTFDPDQPALF